jgi:molybdopterin converting factor subunit 1
MTVQVLCFAQLRDHVGEADCALALPEGARGEDVLAELRQRHPRIGPLLDVCRLAVNWEYVAGDVMLRDGDEVAILPPVSGG